MYSLHATQPQTPYVPPVRAAHTPSSGTWSLRALAVTRAAALVSRLRERGGPGHPLLAPVNSSPFALELAGLILDLCFHARGHMYSTALHCLSSSSITPWGRQAKSSSGETVPVVRVEDVVPGKVGVLVHTVMETLWPAVFMPLPEAGAEVCCLWVMGLGGKTQWAWLWAWPVEGGVTLGRLLPLDQVETQACTTKQNRICTCKPGWYCTLGRQEGCRLCVALRKCAPGFGVAKPGMGPGPEVLGVPPWVSPS